MKWFILIIVGQEAHFYPIKFHNRVFHSSLGSCALKILNSFGFVIP